MFGLKALKPDKMAAYLDRLEDLAEFERGADQRGGLDPLDLAEWLVATAEKPATRGEAVNELHSALQALSDFEEKEKLSREAAVAALNAGAEEARAIGRGFDNGSIAPFVGAALTLDHRARLVASLLATECFTDADRTLFRLARRWEPKALHGWVLDRIAVMQPVKPKEEREDWEEAKVEMWRLQELTWLLDQEALLNPLFEQLEAREDEIDELWEDDESERTEMLREERRAELFLEARDEIVKLLSELPP